MKKAKKQEQVLRREEWDFSAVPEFELEACVRYELVREVTEYRDFFGERVFEKALREECVQLMNTKDYLLSARQHLFANIMYQATDDLGPPTANEVPVELVALTWQDLPFWFRERVAAIVNGNNVGIKTHRFPRLNAAANAFSLNGESGEQVFQLTIDWKQSDTSLVDDFRDWLRKNRPEQVAVRTLRGRLSFRDDLNALSAMRLRHIYSAKEATEISKAVFGKPLYSDSYAWDRAASRGVNLFRKHFSHVSGPASMTMKAVPRGRPRSS